MTLRPFTKAVLPLSIAIALVACAKEEPSNAEKAKSALRESAQSIQKTTSTLTEVAKDEFQEAKEKSGEVLDKAKEKTAELGEKVKAGTQETLEATKDGLKSATNKTKDSLQKAKTTTNDVIKKLKVPNNP